MQSKLKGSLVKADIEINSGLIGKAEGSCFLRRWVNFYQMQQPGQVEVKLSQDLRTEGSGNDPAKVGRYLEFAKLPSL